MGSVHQIKSKKNPKHEKTSNYATKNRKITNFEIESSSNWRT